MRISIILILSFLTFCSCKTKQKMLSTPVAEIEKESQLVFEVDFEKNSNGLYTEDMLKADVGKTNWNSIDGRGEIVDDITHGKVLKVSYPEGGVGPKQGGVQFEKPLPVSNEYYLEYYIKFGDNFDFVRGGKLPGLTSGGAKYTGGNHPTKGEGWSARHMWQEDGKLILYFYFIDMKETWGEVVPMVASTPRNKWVKIAQHLIMNTGDNNDGSMKVWVDDKKVVDENNIRYRLAPLGDIDVFYFSTFHGGNTPDFAPANDCYIYYDDIKIYTSKPEK